MKTNQIAVRCILAALLVCLLLQIYSISCYIIPAASGESWEAFAGLFLIQSICFAVCILAVFLLDFLRKMKREYTSPFESLLLVNGEGKIKSEFLLRDKHSFLITGKKNGREVFAESTPQPEPGRYLYGICNLVGGYWYFESVSGERPVGLRRGNENVIYRLKQGIPYQLSASDVIYADTCKIVIKQQKRILEGI